MDLIFLFVHIITCLMNKLLLNANHGNSNFIFVSILNIKYTHNFVINLALLHIPPKPWSYLKYAKKHCFKYVLVNKKFQEPTLI